jgi:hypothetical protein
MFERHWQRQFVLMNEALVPPQAETGVEVAGTVSHPSAIWSEQVAEPSRYSAHPALVVGVWVPFTSQDTSRSQAKPVPVAWQRLRHVISWFDDRRAVQTESTQ